MTTAVAPRAPPWTYAVLALTLVLVAAWQGREEERLQRPRDLAHGLTLAADAYVPPPGCPLRQWFVGEYLPRACLKGYAIGRMATHVGLERFENGPRLIGRRHNWIWVRQGSDALGVACAVKASCRVLTVVENRFAPAVPHLAQASPGPDFHAEPLSFTLTFFLESLAWTLPLGVIGLAVLTQWGRL